MNEWTVVSVLVVLIGLFMTVGKPLLTLNTSITHLQEAVNYLRDEIKVLTGRTDSQEAKLQNHETRISILEERQRENSSDK